MPNNCIVPNCKRRRNEFVTFHRIPTIKYQRQIWLDHLNLPSTSNGRVCSEHFLPSDFVSKGKSRTLNPNAFPEYIYPYECEYVDGDVAEIEIQYGDMMNTSIHYEGIHDASMYDMSMDVDVHNISADIWISANESIFKEHNYATIRQNEINRCCKASAQTIDYLKQTIDRLNEEIKSVRLELKSSRKENQKFANFSKLSEFLQELFLVLMKHYKEKSKPKQYSPILRQFALTLHYHSPESYRFVRREFNECLPHPQTILSWYRVVDGSPGFTVESLDAIAELQKRTPYPIIVGIVVDGMAIRKHLQKVGNCVIGYTDFGGALPDTTTKTQLAKEALIYHAVGVNVPFKLPIGYFLINSLTGKQLSHLTETAISLVLAVEVIPGSLTFDGLRANFTMADELGCDFSDVHNLVTSFEVDGQTIYVFPDMCHMVKLARNFLSDEEEFLDGQGRCISWKYFLNLNNFQNRPSYESKLVNLTFTKINLTFSLGLHLSNKLRNLHVRYQNQIMKVYLATQLFSASVADAIEFCDETLQLPDFKYSQGTVEFIRIVNDCFDIFNSHNMTETGFKQPIHINNFDFVVSRLDTAREYFLSLKHVDGQPVYTGQRKTFVVGFLTLIQSMKGYFKEFMQTKKLLTFIPTYRWSQDSAEIFNGHMRSFNGCNTNPSAISLRSAYKKSLIYVQFRDKFTGNCKPLETLPILNITSATKKVLSQPAHYIDDKEFEDYFRNAITFTDFSIYDQAKHKAYYCIIAHISGFIARRLSTILKCSKCSKALIFKNNKVLDGNIDLGSQESDCESDDQCMENEEFFYDGIYNEATDDIDGDDFEMEKENSEDDVEINVGQVDDISKKYFQFIKKKDKGALFYPSDSLYRVIILAERTFKTALKESGGKMLSKKFTLSRMVFTVHSLYHKYSDVIFTELSEHLLLEISHTHSLIENIARFYLNIRINFLNKTVSSNNGRRQKLLHLTHFEGM